MASEQHWSEFFHQPSLVPPVRQEAPAQDRQPFWSENKLLWLAMPFCLAFWVALAVGVVWLVPWVWPAVQAIGALILFVLGGLIVALEALLQGLFG